MARVPAHPFTVGNPGGPGRPKGPWRFVSAQKWTVQNGWPKLLLGINGYREVVNPKTKEVKLRPISEKGWTFCLGLAIAYGIGKPKEQLEVTTELPLTIQQFFVNLRSAGFNGIPTDVGGNNPSRPQLADTNAERSEMVRDGSVGADALVEQAAGNGDIGPGSSPDNG